MVQGFFVTGIHTSVGKTFFITTLIRTLNALKCPAQAIKPVSSVTDKEESDPVRLARSMNRPTDQLSQICPWSVTGNLAPAAKMQEKAPTRHQIAAFCKQSLHRLRQTTTVLLIEGVGGLLSPVTPHLTNLDLLCCLGLPVIVVTDTYLGSVNHTLLTIRVLEKEYQPPHCLIVNHTDPNHEQNFHSERLLRPFLSRGYPIFSLPHTTQKDQMPSPIHEFFMHTYRT